MKDYILILGIGNILMGDEGVGAHAARLILEKDLPEGVKCIEGGTGGFVLLEEMQEAKRVIIIDATVDGKEVGTIRRIEPKFSRDYPKTLTAHDIGLKDMIDAFYLLGKNPNVTLFTISISSKISTGLELSAEITSKMHELTGLVMEEANKFTAECKN